MSKSTTFIAIYRGATVGEAHLLAVTTDQDLVQQVLSQILATDPGHESDPSVRALETGRRDALRAAMPSPSGSGHRR